jgi:CHASE3 domain sensor protein
MTKAYVDEETAERGFLLTHDLSFLQPYNSGELEAASARTELITRFAGDPTSLRILSQVDEAATAWRTRIGDPEIAAFESGSLTGSALVASVSEGRELFNALRARLSDLQERINQLVSRALQDSGAAQTTANDVTIAAAIAAILLASLAIWQLRTSFALPLNRLVEQVRRVSGGDLDHSVDVPGPQEVVTVGAAVEAMRTRIRDESGRSATAARQVARYEEAERIASSLGDTVIRQLFTTSLALQSAASRYPIVSPVLTRAISDIDRALKDLQSAIFELTSAPVGRQPLGNQVLDLVDQLEAGLGAAPEVQLAGSLDSELLQPVAADVVAVVRDVVSTVIRPSGAGSTVSLSTKDGQLRLRITGGPAAWNGEAQPATAPGPGSGAASRSGPGPRSGAESGAESGAAWEAESRPASGADPRAPSATASSAEREAAAAKSASAWAESAPALNESAAVSNESAPASNESAAVSAESALTPNESAPAWAESAPTSNESAPVWAESAPTPSESAAVSGALAGVRARAERLGGTCVVYRSADSVTISWQVPVPLRGAAITPPATSPAVDS